MSELAATLNGTMAYLRTYVAMSTAQAAAATLFVFHTHAFEAAETTAYMHVSSAERESGKSRLLEALEFVVARPLKTGGTTAAALARAVSADPPPTLLLDEGDNIFKRDREYVATLLAILNDGYRRGGRTLLCLPPAWKPTFLQVFAPKAIAGLGRLPDTLQSRSIPIVLKRRTKDEQVERFRQRAAAAHAAPLREQLAVLAEEHVDQLTRARPALPDELGDRAQDVWEPLIAIADLAGGTWPAAARAAAIRLMAGGDADDGSLGVRLLADVRTVFDSEGVTRLASKTICDHLRAEPEAPWDAMSEGKGLTQRTLASMLRRYEIRSGDVRVADGSVVKGYKQEHFEDAWRRYLPPVPEGAPPSATTATTAQPGRLSANSKRYTDDASSGSDRGATPHGDSDVADVADKTAHPGNGRVPLPGDQGFRAHINGAHQAGHITRAERLRRLLLHDRLIAVGYRPPPAEDDDIPF